MRKNNKTWLLGALLVWTLAEVGYRTYVNAAYGSHGLRRTWMCHTLECA
jgi:hypothetical protein